MQKRLIAVAVAGALLSPFAVFAEDAPPANPLSFNIGVVSDYLFRGVSQTHGAPAIQGGVDYAFSNGFYIGAWGSNITWVEDFLGSGNLEVDVYGGYKGSLGGDVGYDIGYITYNYPGKGSASPTNLANPNTQEIYAALSYKWLTAKYSYATSPYFIGWYGGTALDQKTGGSDYLELNANYDMGNGWTLVGHVGSQKVKNSVEIPAGLKSATYQDWKVGVTKDVGFGVVGIAYSATDTSGTCTSTAGGTNPYCWGTGGISPAAPTGDFKNVSRDTVVLSFSKAF